MNPFRAKRIADYFSEVGIFQVSNQLEGIEVSFHGNRAYFDDETAFWAFLFYLAHAVHHESLVTEAQSQLIA
jgi:hypothetical protein